MDNLSPTDVILLKCHFYSTWFSLWRMAKSLVIWVIQVPWQSTKWRCRQCIVEDGVIFMLLLEEIRFNLGHKGSQRVLMLHASHTPQTDELSLVLWSTVSQNLRPHGAARTMWVYFTHCQKSTLKESKLGVHLVLKVLAKLMIGENSSWEFPKVGVHLILEVCLILETRR